VFLDQNAANGASGTRTRAASGVHADGVIAGIIAAATVALWFLLIDLVNGTPLRTPSVLGTALFQGPASLDSPMAPPVSAEMVLMFTWVHGLVFVVIGVAVSRVLALAERRPSLGFGILLLFLVLEFGFTVSAMLFTEPVLGLLTWPAILGANLLAASSMTGYFWLRRPALKIPP
jgi:hypothetical protein